jgi:hypothetical protein
MAEAILEDHIRRRDMPKSTFVSPSSTVDGRKVEKVFQGNNAEPGKEQEKGDILRAALAKPESASHPCPLRTSRAHLASCAITCVPYESITVRKTPLEHPQTNLRVQPLTQNG